ncbi:hypothetical protein Trydic_g8086 [Trypoxylus dichotomus]
MDSIKNTGVDLTPSPAGFFASLMSKYQRALTGSISESNDDLEEIKEEDEEIEIASEKCSLINLTFTPLQVAAFSSIIQEALDKINILGLIGGLPNVKTVLDYRPLIDKYEQEDTQSFIFDPETLEPYEGEEERDNLLKETSENLAAVKNLTAHMEKDKVALSNELQKKTELLGQLKDEYEDLIYENDIKYKYIDKWEKARCVQNQVDMDRKVENYNNIIREYQCNYERENRINLEIESYINEMDETYRNSIEMWIERYDKDLETKEIDIQCLKEKREEQMTRLEAMSKLYETHKQEIEVYLVQKEERRKQAELLQKLNAAATKIQSWWRGIMFRRGLGPYRKKKGKKTKKGQKKK